MGINYAVLGINCYKMFLILPRTTVLRRSKCYTWKTDVQQRAHWLVVYYSSWRSYRKYLCVLVCLSVGCLTSQQQASVSQGRICSENFTCCHTEIEVADQTFYLTQSQYTDTGPTSPSADPITPGAWQGKPLECQFLSHWYDSTPKKIPPQAGFEPGTFRSRGGRLNH